MNAGRECEASSDLLRNGAGAAAILSAGVGCFVLGVIAVIADKVQPVARSLNFYKPTGPLSGVTSVAILIWLLTWVVLHLVWRRRDIALRRINAIAIGLLILGLLLTVPPVGDLL
jgi:hypothetical protein